jgi:hypothetical protein
MGTPTESVTDGMPAVKPDRVQKHKGGSTKAAKQTDFLLFYLSY